MEPLSWTGPNEDRIVTATLDPELEDYRLLAYVQRVDASYREGKLYPWLDELDNRIGQLRELVDRAGTLAAGLPTDVVGLDLAQQTLLRRPLPLPAVWDQVRFALEKTIPPLIQLRDRGEGLRDELNGHIRMEPVGLIPLDVREGWLLLRQRNEALIYAYSLPLVREVQPAGHHRHVRTRFFDAWGLSLGRTYAHMKAELARAGPLPNPALFVFEADITLPRIETFLPLAKRITYEVVSAALV
ncbi:MAG: hypothetical protein KBH07_00165 [Flavobacteriales bacterium]|nr:hypothetical protein [Flavobacteriales bacterium]MBP9079079.1 hypothetical protein [Flavobacteriales bacterium]